MAHEINDGTGEGYSIQPKHARDQKTKQNKGSYAVEKHMFNEGESED